MGVTATIITEIFIPGAICLLGLIVLSGAVIDALACHGFSRYLASVDFAKIPYGAGVAVFVAMFAYLLGALCLVLVHSLPRSEGRRQSLNVRIWSKHRANLALFAPRVLRTPLMPPEGEGQNRAEVIRVMDLMLPRMWVYVASVSPVADREMMFFRNLQRLAKGSLPGLVALTAGSLIYTLVFFTARDANRLLVSAIISVAFASAVWSADWLDFNAIEWELEHLVNAFIVLYKEN